VFAIDASDSLGSAGRQETIDLVSAALKSAPKGASSGVVVFGGNARVLATVRDKLELSGATVVVDGSRTDLASGLRLAGAVVPGDAKRRVVLLSDGRRTVGDEIKVAQSLQELGVRVDVIPVGSSLGADAALAGVEGPTRARVGENITISARVASTVDQRVRVTLQDSAGKEIGAKDLEVKASVETPVEFSTVVSGSGVARYSVEVTGTQESVSANNTGSIAVEILGPARVLVVEGSKNAAATVLASLTANAIAYDVVDPGKLGDAISYASYNSVVLADVDVRSIAAEQVAALTTAVRELGKGLVVIGGPNSYGPGGYLGSDLEQLLPVISDVKDPLRRKSVAEVMAIDSSGSMAACHCEDSKIRTRIDGGIIKTDIARAGAQQAIESLQPTDEVGVLTIDDNKTWVINLGPIPTAEDAKKKLQVVKPGGSTNLAGALSESAKKLRLSKAALKHIVLFTDGFTPEGVIQDVAKEAASLHAEGMTISVVATGEGAFDALKSIADNGGGRFYPGRDLREIPKILVEESQIAARSLINEGNFLPTITSSSPVVKSLRAAPELLGYVATTAKPASRTLMRIGDEEDPLLTSWQAGIGKVSAWMSDGNGRWTKQWAPWEGNRDFWTGVIKDTFPISSDGSATASVRDDQLVIRVNGASDWPDGASAVAQVRSPDGSLREVRLDRVAGDAFAADIPVEDAGTYTTGIKVEGSSGRLLTASALVNKSYSPEYALGANDPERLKRISRAAGGRGIIDAKSVYSSKGLVAGYRRVPIAWPMLLWRLRLRRRLLVGGETVPVKIGATLPSVRLGRGGAAKVAKTSTTNGESSESAVSTATSRIPVVDRPPSHATVSGGTPAVSKPASTVQPQEKISTPATVTPPIPPTSPPPANPSANPSDASSATVNRLLDRKRKGRE
jgi:Mg-chelatase subunit ChlD